MEATETRLEEYLEGLGRRSSLARKVLEKRFRLYAENDKGYEVLTRAEAVEQFVEQGHKPDYHSRIWDHGSKGGWSFEDFGKECLNYYHFLTGSKAPVVAKIKAAKRKPSFVVKTLQGPDTARDFMPPKKPAERTEAVYLAVLAKWGKGKRVEFSSFESWQRDGKISIYAQKGSATLSISDGLLRRSKEGSWGREEITFYEVA
jgi:hypothetical protein